jgi:hypothetical protein
VINYSRWKMILIGVGTPRSGQYYYPDLKETRTLICATVYVYFSKLKGIVSLDETGHKWESYMERKKENNF